MSDLNLTGALILIIHNDSLLLLHDKAFNYRDLNGKLKFSWTIPGGTREIGDSIATTAMKELFEESKGLLYIHETYFVQAESVGAFADIDTSSKSFFLLFFLTCGSQYIFLLICI